MGVSVRPEKLSRLQQKVLKQRCKDFDAALKEQARASGWRYARGELFRQSGDWFLNVFPILLWERGILARFMIKPMALDPLFWDIAGLPENNGLPLSFRAQGAWVLRPPGQEENVGLDISDVEQLAREFLLWSTRRADEALKACSIETMLGELENGSLAGHNRAVVTCLHILAENFESAARLCQTEDPDVHPLMREGGGFTTHHPDGSMSTFMDQARDWIARKRQNAMSAA